MNSCLGQREYGTYICTYILYCFGMGKMEKHIYEYDYLAHDNFLFLSLCRFILQCRCDVVPAKATEAFCETISVYGRRHATYYT